MLCRKSQVSELRSQSSEDREHSSLLQRKLLVFATNYVSNTQKMHIQRIIRTKYSEIS